MLISADRNPNTVGAKLVLGLASPGSQLPSIRDGVRNGSIQAVLVIGEDLTAEAGFTTEDLDKLDYLAVIAHSASPTAKKAAVVLPGVTFAEKYGTMINVTGRLQRLNQAILPLGNAKSDWEILRDLCVAVDNDESLAQIKDVPSVVKLLAAQIAEFKDITWGSIGDSGYQLVETGETIPLIEREHGRQGH
jgi:NADH-quinone oxidoreductase subunit G